MSNEQYLLQILERESVNNSFYSPVLAVRNILDPLVKQWAGNMLNEITPSGSFSKGTANRSGTDIDLFISLSNKTSETLKEIYDGLFNWMQGSGYSPRKQNVSININVNEYDVDLVPAKKHDFYSKDHSLYHRRGNTRIKTNIERHITYVKHSGCILEIRALKLWRDQHKIDFPSFYLEMIVIEALKDKNGSLCDNILRILEYLSSNFQDVKVLDPANSNNIISDDMTKEGKAKIKLESLKSLKGTWEQFIR